MKNNKVFPFASFCIILLFSIVMIFTVPVRIARAGCNADWLDWERHRRTCDPVEEPDCEDVFCHSFCFTCKWIGFDPDDDIFWELCCDDGTAVSTCNFALAICEGIPGCCADTECLDDNCPTFHENDNEAATAWLDQLIHEDEYGCCLGFWNLVYYDEEEEECVEMHTYPGEPRFCAACCDGYVTVKYVAYFSPYIMGYPYSNYATCASLHDCFDDEVNEWWNPECGEVGIAEISEHHCCGCEIL